MWLLDLYRGANFTIINEYINNNTVFLSISAILTFVVTIYGLVEIYKNSKVKKSIIYLVALTIAVIILSKFLDLVSVVIVFLIIVLAIMWNEKKKSSQRIINNMKDNKRKAVAELISDAELDKEYNSVRLVDCSGAFIKAKKCLEENCPKEAIKYLNKCNDKIRYKIKFVLCYADALMMLENYKGALEKLDSLSPKKLKKKKRFNLVLCKKAICFRGLNLYLEEMECYNKIIANKYKERKFYYHRGEIKTHILEIYKYLPSAEKVVCQSNSVDEFVASIFEDFDKALKHNDEYTAKILSYKGACYFCQQEYERGLELLKQSQDIDDDLQNNFLYFGVYYLEQKDYKRADNYLKKAISCDLLDDRAYYYMALLYKEKGNYDEVLKYASKSLSIFPYRDDCFGMQGDSYYFKNMYTEAIYCYSKAIQLRSRPEYFRRRAICYYNKQTPDYEKAYKDGKKLCEIEENERNQFKALFYKLKLDGTIGCQMKLEDIDKLVLPYKEQKEFWGNIGVIYEMYGYLDKAEEYCKNVIKHCKNNISSRYNYAQVLWKLNQIDKAAEQLEEAIKSGTKDVEYYKRLVECYQILGNTENEIRIQYEISKINKYFAKIKKENGDNIYNMGKYKSAQSYYETALTYSEKNNDLLNNLGCTYYYQEMYEKAIHYFEKIIDRDANYYLAYYNLGNCYLRINKTSKAKEYFGKLNRIYPQFEPVKKMLNSMDIGDIKMIAVTNEGE